MCIIRQTPTGGAGGGGGVGHFVVFSDCVIFAMTFFFMKNVCIV